MKRVFDPAWITTYDLKVYIETGLGGGNSLRFMTKYPFEEIYSIEILSSRITAAKDRGQADDNRVNLVQGHTLDEIDGLLTKTLAGDSRNFLWFLDAHVGPNRPDGDEEIAISTELRLPQEDELRLMSSKRDLGRDVIVMDDLQLYPHWREFFFDVLESSHEITVYSDQRWGERMAIALPQHGS